MINTTTKTKLRENQNCKCFICNKRMSKKNTTADHLIPRHLFYRNGLECEHHENIVGAHKSCNERKAGKLPKINDVVRACDMHGYDHRAALRRYFIFKHKIYPMFERQAQITGWRKAKSLRVNYD